MFQHYKFVNPNTIASNMRKYQIHIIKRKIVSSLIVFDNFEFLAAKVTSCESIFAPNAMNTISERYTHQMLSQ